MPRGAVARAKAAAEAPDSPPANAARRIEYRPLAELVADPRNPKGHDQDQIDDSVDRFGFIDPVVMDHRTGRLISGHGRTDALRKMEAAGQSPPDGIRRAPDGTWLAPVVIGWSSRSDTEAAAALVALNRSTELGGWVDEALLTLLDDLAQTGDEALVGVGFSTDDIETLTRRLEAEGVWGGSSSEADLLDEFRDQAGLDGDDDVAYNPGYGAKVTIEMRDSRSIKALRLALSLDDHDHNDEAGFVAVRWKRYPVLKDIDAQQAEREVASLGQDHPTPAEFVPLRPSQPVDETDEPDVADEIDRAAREVVRG